MTCELYLSPFPVGGVVHGSFENAVKTVTAHPESHMHTAVSSSLHRARLRSVASYNLASPSSPFFKANIYLVFISSGREELILY